MLPFVKDYAKEELTKSELKVLKNYLLNTQAEDISGFDDARDYIKCLHSFRENVADITELNGENYIKTIQSLFSVGEDGVYKDELRFIYELIQNMDDCDYKTNDKPELTMSFDYNDNTITLTYNEIGFLPINVFGITGIAEAIKNASPDKLKLEIGEKGIGFKSVFGVADKVSIHSGWFSFTLEKTNFTIPNWEEPQRQENYPGTVMTLYLSDGKASYVFAKLKERYNNEQALILNNPILFLNKLKKLTITDGTETMEFKVTETEDTGNSQGSSKDIVISLTLNGKESAVPCFRYTKNITYNQEEYNSRYGDTEGFPENGKVMPLALVVPKPGHIPNDMGKLYSFLPTKLDLSIPLAINAPFKLDASREYVDSQDKNAWFLKTCDELNNLLFSAYQDISKQVEQNIVFYMPGNKHNIFIHDDEKAECLSRNENFTGEKYTVLPLFMAADQEFYSAAGVAAIDSAENDSPERIYEILNPDKKLFIPPKGFNKKRLKNLGIDIIEDIPDSLFQKALEAESATADALEYIATHNYFEKCDFKIPENTILTISQINEILRYAKVKNKFISKEALKKFPEINWKVKDDTLSNVGKIEDVIKDLFESLPSDIQEKLRGKACRQIEDFPESAFFLGSNMLLLSGKTPEEAETALADLCEVIGNKGNVFTASVRLNNASKALDSNENQSDKDYLEQLRRIRIANKSVLGNAYDNYIKLICESDANPAKFLYELLQNADDCAFAEGIVPEFSLKLENGKMISFCSEKGFTKANVRAITAIGESTKKKLLNPENSNTTGEKGIGFKTVFNAASRVEIHSGDFHFSLSSETPTIPDIIKDVPKTAGTRMIFTCKDNVVPSLSKEDALKLCLCLHNLRHIVIGAHDVCITDEGNKRTVTIDGTDYIFMRFTRSFEVKDNAAIAEREGNRRHINHNQSITIYIPEFEGSQDHLLYCGLPTEVKINSPLCIDAPFMLNTSRNDVLGNNKWNDCIKGELYDTMKEMLEAFRGELRIKALSLVGKAVNNRITLFEINYLNEYEKNSYYWNGKLKACEFLPTLDDEKFIAPNKTNTFILFPSVITRILKESGEKKHSDKLILDVTVDIIVENKNYADLLVYLGCRQDVSEALNILNDHIDYIRKDDFRKEVYAFLKRLYNSCIQDKADSLKAKLLSAMKTLEIIPVYKTDEDGFEFISWNDCHKTEGIFIENNAKRSASNYYVLNTDIMKADDYNNIFGANIITMGDIYKNEFYKRMLEGKFNSLEAGELYDYLLKEFKNLKELENSPQKEIFLSLVKSKMEKKQLPLRNMNGNIVYHKLFVPTEDVFYDSETGEWFGGFNSLFKNTAVKIAVKYECITLAEAIGCTKLEDITADDFISYLDLYNADMEDFQIDDNGTETCCFKNYILILIALLEKGLIEGDIESVLKNALGTSAPADEQEDPDFPADDEVSEERVRFNIDRLEKFRIVSRTVERTIRFIESKDDNNNSKYYSLNSYKREETLNMYKPDGREDKCFCQMCLKVKPFKFMEVDNIELTPEYFYPDTKIALCLECGKEFKNLRKKLPDDAASEESANNTKYEKEYLDFLRNIINADVSGSEPISVNIGSRTITFRQLHLARIKAILNNPNRKPIEGLDTDTVNN